MERRLVPMDLPWHLPRMPAAVSSGGMGGTGWDRTMDVTVTIETAARIWFPKVKRSWELGR